MSDLPPDFLNRLQAIKGKRAKIVVAHILEHGFITTETLENIYGYKHPPRAVQDVRDQGVPLESFTVNSEDGRRIAAYRFAPVHPLETERRGRTTLPKTLKRRLIAESDATCALCTQQYDPRFLQIDHRVPYPIARETLADNFMLVCRSCNRSKSWACEHCANWQTQHTPEICMSCFWCNPANYAHIALVNIKRLELIWQEQEHNTYQTLETLAAERHLSLTELVKTVLAEYARKLSADE